MKHQLHAVEVSKHAVIDGNHPFGSILVDDKGSVLPGTPCRTAGRTCASRPFPRGRCSHSW
nr:hypothetical protein JVH1_8893 [Rhodococcus sp. JVH1]